MAIEGLAKGEVSDSLLRFDRSSHRQYKYIYLMEVPWSFVLMMECRVPAIHQWLKQLPMTNGKRLDSFNATASSVCGNEP
jgi:hypothetical protein